MAACDARVSGDAGKHVDDALSMRAVELERLAEMGCLECGSSGVLGLNALTHYSITPVFQSLESIFRRFV